MSRISTKMVGFTAILILSGCGSNQGWGDPSPSQEPITLYPLTPPIDQQIQQLQSGDRQKLEISSDLSVDHIEQLELSAKKIQRLEASEFANVRRLLPALSNLHALKIEGRVSDSDFKEICQLRSLQELNLPQGDLSNKGLAAVRTLKNLFLFRFRSKRVTDEGLTALESLSSLRFLHLLEVPMTDKSLPVIARLKKLESFYLDGGKATENGLIKFSKSRPDVHFHKDQIHLDGTGHSP